MERFIRKSSPLEKRITESSILNCSLRKIQFLSRPYTKSAERLRKDFTQYKEYTGILKQLDVSTNPHKFRNPFKKKTHAFLAPSNTTPQTTENDFDLLINALFFNSKNKFTLPSSGKLQIQEYQTELFVRNLKRIKPIYIGCLEETKTLPIEDFWNSEISHLQVVRWDIFEESLISCFIQKINIGLGIIRKINWNWLLPKLFKKLSVVSSEIEIFPGHPGLAAIGYTGPSVSFKQFQSYVSSGKLSKLLEKSINFNTFYLSERFSQSVYTYSCGTEYKGSWQDYRRNGIGKLKLQDGSIYDGTFFQGQRSGYGKLIGRGCMYLGYWDKDYIEGPGEISYFDLSRVTGIWKKGQLSSGKLIWIGGEYIGLMNKFGFNGNGTLVTKTGDLKKGSWSNGKLEGECEILYKNGNHYFGNFTQDVLTGIGFIENQEYLYQGSIVNFTPNGFGKITYKSNGEYEGEFSEGEPNGKGLFKINNSTFKGEFVQGKLSGNGEKIVENLYEYNGEFYDSNMHGKGLFQCISIDCKYDGEFKLNRFSGRGKLFLDELTISASWANGKIHGACEIFSNEFTFNGCVLNSNIKGKGHAIFKENCEYDGWWENNLPSGKGEAKENPYTISAYFLKGTPISKHKLSHFFFLNLEKMREKFENLIKVLDWLNSNISLI